MDCRDAQLIFMKFLDGDCECINNNELQEHILTCKSCRDDYSLYRTMVDCFNATQQVTIPCEFEQLEKVILEKIYLIDPHFSLKKYMLKNSIAILFIRHLIFFMTTLCFIIYTICKGYNAMLNRISPTKRLEELKNSGILIAHFLKAKLNRHNAKKSIVLLSIVVTLSAFIEAIKKTRR